MGDVLNEPAEVNLCKDCPEEDPAVQTDQIDQAIAVGSHERAQWRMHWRVDKYEGEVTPEMIASGVQPVETLEFADNLLLNAGIQRMLDLLIGAGGQAFNAANSRIGVGNSSTAAAATQTDLQAAAGSSNRQFKLVSNVSRSAQTITWTASFSTSQANFDWLEFGIDPGTADGTTVVAPLLNRKVIAAGTKPSSQTWVATATLTIS